MGTNMKAVGRRGGGGFSRSCVLSRKIFQNWVWKSRLPDNLLTPPVERLFCSPRRPQIWKRVGSCAVSHSCAIWSVVHMSAFFSGNTSSFLISWPDTGGMITQCRPNHPKFFFFFFFLSLSLAFFSWFLQCFPGGRHCGSTASGGQRPPVQRRCLVAQVR